MRFLRFFYLVFGLWLSFTGIAMGKPMFKSKKLPLQYITATSVLSSRHFILQKYNPHFSIYKYKKNAKIKSCLKTGMRRKALQLELTAMFKIYSTKFLLHPQFTYSHNYGVSVQYWVALHTYLHLYQLY